MSLVGVANLSSLVDTDVSLAANWTREGEVEALITSDSSPTTYQFAPVSSTDSGVYSYAVTVSPADLTYLAANSNNATFTLTVQPYPQLVVSQTVLSGEQCAEGMTTLRGGVSLHPNTPSDHTLSYTWRDPQGNEVSGDSGDLTAAEGELVVRNVMENTGQYTLEVCITIAGSDVIDHCSEEAMYSISNAGMSH